MGNRYAGPQSWLWTLQWPRDQLQLLSVVVRELLKNAVSDYHTEIEGAFVKAQEPGKKLQLTTGD